MDFFSLIIVAFIVFSVINNANKKKKRQQQRQVQRQNPQQPGSAPQSEQQAFGRSNTDEMGVPLPMPQRRYRLEDPMQSQMQPPPVSRTQPAYIGEMLPDGMAEGECDEDHDAWATDQLVPAARESLVSAVPTTKESVQEIKSTLKDRSRLAAALAAPQIAPGPRINASDAVTGIIWSEILKRPDRSRYVGSTHSGR